MAGSPKETANESQRPAEQEHVDRNKRSLMAAAEDGVYIPPAKRRQLELERQQALKDAAEAPDSLHIQRSTWEEQTRVIHGTINRLNATTLKPLIHEIMEKVNLIRLRGVLAKSLLLAAVSAPVYAPVYASFLAVINSKLPEVGELVVNRTILAFRRHFRRREKANCSSVAVFLGHLFHQSMVHELVLLQILSVLLDGDPTDDSVEVAIQLLTTTGRTLLEVSPAGVRAVLERLRALLHEGGLSKRVEVKMEHLLAMRKNGFRDLENPIPDDLDLVEESDQITFEIDLDDPDIKRDDHLDIFDLDSQYLANEKVWSKIKAEILGLNSDDDGESETDDSENDERYDDESEDGVDGKGREEVAPAANQLVVHDLSEADLVHLRRTIYLTIMSSATFEECAHKLARINIPAGREEELVNMLIECCSQERTFLRYYGLISARFCLMDDRWRDAFITAFISQYNTIHRLETNKLRNVAKLFAHLLHSDSMPWSVLSTIRINEEETTSSSRIFIKILIQEIAEAMGIAKLKQRFETQDPEQQSWYSGMFPKDNVRNTRYAINFFTSIGLGPLTDDLRDFLKNAPKIIMAQANQLQQAKEDDDSSTSTSSSSSSNSSSSSSSSSSSRSSSGSSSSRSSCSSSSSSSRSSYSRRKTRRRDSSSSSSSGSYSVDSRDRRKGSSLKTESRPRSRKGSESSRD